MTIAELRVRLRIDGAEATNKRMSDTARGLNNAASAARNLAGSLDTVDFSVLLGGLHSAIDLTSRLFNLLKTPFDIAVTFDKLDRGLIAVTGSAEAAEAQFQRLLKVAKLPGLGVEEAVSGFTRLRAAGLSVQLAERSLKAFGNALATIGGSKAEMGGVILALSQIASKGKLSAEEVNQLAERIPQIRIALKEAFGTGDTEVIQKMGLTAENAIERIVAALEKARKAQGGISNDLDNLGDKAKLALRPLGEALVPIVTSTFPALERLLASITPMFERMASAAKALAKDGTLKAWGDGLIGTFERLNKIISLFAGVLTAVTTNAIIRGLFTLGGMIYRVVKAVQAMGIAMLLISGVTRNFPGIIAGLTAMFAGIAAFGYVNKTLNDKYFESPIAGLDKKTGAASAVNASQALGGSASSVSSAMQALGGGSDSDEWKGSFIETAGFTLPQMLLMMAGVLGIKRTVGPDSSAGSVDAAVRMMDRMTALEGATARTPAWMLKTFNPLTGQAVGTAARQETLLEQIARNTDSAAVTLRRQAVGGSDLGALGVTAAELSQGEMIARVFRRRGERTADSRVNGRLGGGGFNPRFAG
jgi:tape measure domain-containing protein